MDTILAAVDLADVATTVAASGVVLVGVYLAFKGIRLAKRLIGAV